MNNYLLGGKSMREKNKYTLYLVLLVLAIGVVYTACKDITPEQEHITNEVELKLSK